MPQGLTPAQHRGLQGRFQALKLEGGRTEEGGKSLHRRQQWASVWTVLKVAGYGASWGEGLDLGCWLCILSPWQQLCWPWTGWSFPLPSSCPSLTSSPIPMAASVPPGLNTSPPPYLTHFLSFFRHNWDQEVLACGKLLCL